MSEETEFRDEVDAWTIVFDGEEFGWDEGLIVSVSVITDQQITLLANGSLFVHGSTYSQITLKSDPPTKSSRDLRVKAQVLPHKAV